MTKTSKTMAAVSESNTISLDDEETGELIIDTTSGISLDEQREIIANIDAIAGSSRITASPQKIKAKKRGILFPLLINFFAILFLTGGLFVLWQLFKQDDTIIRMNGGELDSTEGRLIEEIRNDFDAARAEIARLNNDLEKAAAFEWQISGFYHAVNDEFNAGRLEEARNILLAMREFIDTPAFSGIRQIEERREINLAMLNAMTRLIDESIRNSRVTEELDAAARTAENAIKEKAAAEQRAEELTGELTAVKQTAEQRAATLAERDRTITELRTQTAELRQTITGNEQRINTLTTQNNSLTQRLSAVQQALTPSEE